MDNIDLTTAMAVIPVLTATIVEAIKRTLKKAGLAKYIEPIKPLLPLIIAFCFTFVPGFGVDQALIGQKIIIALSVTGMTNAGYEMIKKGAKKIAAKKEGGAK